MIKAIFFDVGDTIYHNEEFKAAYPEKLIEMMTRKLHVKPDKAKQMIEDKKEELKKSLNRHVNKVDVLKSFGFTRQQVHDGFFEIEAEKYLQKNDKLQQIFSKLAKYYTLGFITNNRMDMLERILKILKVDIKLFSIIITEDTVNLVKPNSEPFEKALSKSEYKPSECVYVADSLAKDLLPAKKLGFKTVWITDKHGDENKDLFDTKIDNILGIEKALKILNRF